MTCQSRKTATELEINLAEQLAIAEQKIILYETLLNRLDVGIHVIDKNERTIVYNSTMAKLESEDAKNILGKNLLEVMPSLQAKDSTLIKALRAEQPLNDRKQTYINASGKQVVTVNSTTPLFFNEKIVGALEIAKDVTYIQTLAGIIADLHQNLSVGRNSDQFKQPFHARYTFADIIGHSDAIQTAKTDANRAARTLSNVLIYGETGTGKELFAQSIHNASPRKQRPFIGINCAALPEHLLEGLLFGTTKGGFTGAIDRPGFFEQANGGTLLLDEINSMNLDLQAKLLRVLQERSVRRVGASKEISIDVRIISTVNIDPFDAISQKLLRADLYYRLGVVTLYLPSLSEHKEDIPFYVKQFIEQYNLSMGLAVTNVSSDVLESFEKYYWPGNIRELQHAIEGAMNFITFEQEIQEQHLPSFLRSRLLSTKMPCKKINTKHIEPKKLIEHRDSMEKEMISAALGKSEGNITHAAKALGLTRQVLQYKIKKYKLK